MEGAHSPTGTGRTPPSGIVASLEWLGASEPSDPGEAALTCAAEAQARSFILDVAGSRAAVARGLAVAAGRPLDAVPWLLLSEARGHLIDGDIDGVLARHDAAREIAPHTPSARANSYLVAAMDCFLALGFLDHEACLAHAERGRSFDDGFALQRRWAAEHPLADLIVRSIERQPRLIAEEIATWSDSAAI